MAYEEDPHLTRCRENCWEVASSWRQASLSSRCDSAEK